MCFNKRHRMTHAPKHLMSIWCQGEMFKLPCSWQTTKTWAKVKHRRVKRRFFPGTSSTTTLSPQMITYQFVACMGSSKSCSVSFQRKLERYRKVMVHRPIHLEHLFSSADLFKAAKGTKVKLYLQGSQKRSSSSPFRGSVSTPLWIRSKYLPDGVNTLASSWQWARQVQCILKIKIKWSSYIHQLEARKRNQWIGNKKSLQVYCNTVYMTSQLWSLYETSALRDGVACIVKKRTRWQHVITSTSEALNRCHE